MRSKTRQERGGKNTGANVQMKQYKNKKGGLNIKRKKIGGGNDYRKKQGRT
jgi:hypothetical protein